MVDASDTEASRKRAGVWARLQRIIRGERLGSAAAVEEALRDSAQERRVLRLEAVEEDVGAKVNIAHALPLL